MLVSNLRKDSPEGSPLKKIGLQAIYLHRTAKEIAASLGEDWENSEALREKAKTFNAQIGDHWPVSQQKYVFCCLAQVPALLFLFLIEAISNLVPYLVFFTVLRALTLGDAILATYFTFIIIPFLRASVGLAGKRIALDRAKPGEYTL